jgi:tetratricopeptide (TPR) repeat protein
MNFSLSSARRRAFAVLLTALAGCGPNDGSREFASGLDAYRIRDFRKAEKLFVKCVERAPANASAFVYLARVKLEQGDLKAASVAVSEAARIAGEDVDVRMLSAHIAWHLKDYDRAAGIFSALAEDGKLDPVVRSDAYSGLGVVEMTRDRRDMSRVAFLRAIRVNRRNAAAWYHLALLYRDQFGYIESALDQFEFYVRLEKSVDARVQRVQRSLIPELKERIARSAAERPGVSRRNSAVSAAAISKAEAAMKKRTYKTAVSRYEEALAADPLSYPAAMGLAQAWLAGDKTVNGLKQAYRNYKLACELRPSAVSTFLLAGSLAVRLGYNASAVEIYSRAVAANPASLDSIDGLIRVLRKAGKQKEAQAYQLYRDTISVPGKRK